MKKRLMFLAALAVAALSVGMTAAFAASSSSNWHIGYYNTSGKALSMAQASSATSPSLAALNFTNQANTALLVTDQKGSGLLGDLTGKSVTAAATVSGLTGTFTYYGEPSCGGTTAYVRYFFETNTGGKFAETDYWWSNPVSTSLVTNGSASLAPVLLNGANWSDYYGHFGTNANTDGFQGAAAFNAAVAHVTTIGLSFGGGCFFENGVGTTDGSGTFTLNSYTAQ